MKSTVKLLAPALLFLSVSCRKETSTVSSSTSSSDTSSSSSTYYYQSGGTVSKTDKSYSSAITDTSGVYVTNDGTFTLSNSTVKTTASTTSTDSSSFYGLNAIVRVDAASTVILTNSSLTSSGSGANGVLATGTGTTVTLTNDTITTTANGAHGYDATYAAIINATDVNITTSGASSSCIATDRGGGTINVTGGVATAGGFLSAGIYSTGVITVTGATISSTAADGGVIEGSNSIALANTILTGTTDAIKIYHSESGDASGFTGTLTVNGGSLTATAGAAIYVLNETGVVTLKGGATVSTSTGYIIDAVDTSTVTFTASGETLTGNLYADTSSVIAATLESSTTLKGVIHLAALTMDATSTWTVTGNSILTTFSDASGISGTAISNITGNGYDVYYDSSLSGNSALGAKTYTLSGGGYLLPK